MRISRQDNTYQPPRAPANPANRWTDWARALVEGQTRVMSRYGALPMTLAHLTLPLYLNCQRWEHVAWNLCPKIQLAITSILEQGQLNMIAALQAKPIQREWYHLSHSHEHASESEHPRVDRTKAAVVTSPRVWERDARFGQNGPSPFGNRDKQMFERWEQLPLRVAERNTAAQSNGQNAGGGEAGPGSKLWVGTPPRVLEQNSRAALARPHPILALDRTVSLAPLQRVLQRIDQNDATVSLKWRRLMQTDQVFERIIENRRRVEVRARRTTVIPQRRNSISTEAEQAALESRVNHLLGELNRSSKSYSSTGLPAAAPINLEQLTEQVVSRIDQRITAYRERRGKGF